MRDETFNPGQRWHDNQGELSTLMDLLDSIPESIRPHISEALTQRADQDFQVSEILSTLKSLGKDKILALHQAQKKRRKYDQDPDLHKIANTFLVIPEAERVAFAGKFLEFTSLMVDYMANCETFGTEPKESDLQRMRELFVATGEQAVREYLMEVHQTFYQMVLEEPVIKATDEGLLLRPKDSDLS
jgi:hypothetical protein